MMLFNKKLNELCVVMRNSFELNTHFFSEKKDLSPCSYVAKGIRTIAPEANCPPVRVRFRVSFRVGGAIFLGGNCSRTIAKQFV